MCKCWQAYYLKGRSFSCSPGRSNAGCFTVMLYVGEGPRGTNGTCSPLHGILFTPCATHIQIGPLWCWFPSGLACACSRPLWVSPTTSPVRLGVSPAAAPSPMSVFNQRFEALFPSAGALGCAVCFTPPPFIPVYLCVDVGPWGATRRSACPVLRHSESGPLGLSVRECRAEGSASGQTACPARPPLRQYRWPVSVLPLQRKSSLPWLPVSAPPTSLDECFFFISLVSDFLAIRFSVSSVCARRRSVSTYTSILVLSLRTLFYLC